MEGGRLTAITQIAPSWYDKIYDSYKNDAMLSSMVKLLMKELAIVSQTLPIVDEEGRVKVYPVTILERKLMKKGNKVVVAGLVQWLNSFPEDAMWEELTEIQLQFPEFNIDP